MEIQKHLSVSLSGRDKNCQFFYTTLSIAQKPPQHISIQQISFYDFISEIEKMYVRLFILNETRCYIFGETCNNGFRNTEIEIRQSEDTTDQ